METIITFFSGVIAVLIGLFIINRDTGGTEGVKGSIRRAGDHIDRARERVNNIDNGLGNATDKVKESRETVERLEEAEQRRAKRIGNISGLIKRGRKALENIEKKNTSSKD